MVVEEINEIVRVRADFGAEAITPRAFRRGAKVYSVTKVNARWEDRTGAFKRYHFSVEAAGNVWELHLDSRDMSWRLDRVCLEG